MTLSTNFFARILLSMTKREDPLTTLSLLFEFISRSKHEWWKITEKYGLTPLQLHILELLDKGPMPMNRLCTSLVCDASNVTGIVDRLSAHGLIERRDHPSDRRIKLVVLTPKGIEVRQKVLDHIMAEKKGGLSVLTQEELEQFNAILRKLTQRQHTHDDGSDCNC